MVFYASFYARPGTAGSLHVINFKLLFCVVRIKGRKKTDNSLGFSVVFQCDVGHDKLENP